MIDGVTDGVLDGVLVGVTVGVLVGKGFGSSLPTIDIGFNVCKSNADCDNTVFQYLSS